MLKIIQNNYGNQTIIRFPEIKLKTRDAHKLLGYFGNLFKKIHLYYTIISRIETPDKYHTLLTSHSFRIYSNTTRIENS